MKVISLEALITTPAAVNWPLEPLSQGQLSGLNLTSLDRVTGSAEWVSASLESRTSRSFTPLAAQARLSYPQTHMASPYLGVLNTPWFLDYGHLIFWFYFLSTFVIIMWLTTSYGLFTRNVEPRMPIRETRGFSRAQTGDILTAVLPMAWSITMLMHATTHSTNFDENTASTVFTVTVVAYQWGWNYYFPRDVLDTFAAAPKLVGRNRVETFITDNAYERLLEQARGDFITKMTSKGAFASRWGRGTTSNVLNFYLRPVTFGLRLPLVQLHINAALAAQTGSEAPISRSTLSPTSAAALATLATAFENEGALRGVMAWEPSSTRSPNKTSAHAQANPENLPLELFVTNRLTSLGHPRASNWHTAKRGLEPEQLRHLHPSSQKSKYSLARLGQRLTRLHTHHQQRFLPLSDWR